MTELSLHILDIVQNSIKAKATLVKILITEDTYENVFVIEVSDNGVGMSKDFLAHAADPFVTTRTTRKVGLGLSLLKAAALQTGGSFDIFSTPGMGTTVRAVFVHDSIDRQPLGDMASTMATLISCNPKVDFYYHHKYDGQEFSFQTPDVKKVLGDVYIGEQNVLNWISEYIEEGIDHLHGF